MRVRALEDHDVLAPGQPGGRRALWSQQEYELTEEQVLESGERVEVLDSPEPTQAPEPEAEEKPKRRRRTRKQD